MFVFQNVQEDSGGLTVFLEDKRCVVEGSYLSIQLFLAVSCSQFKWNICKWRENREKQEDTFE